MYVIHFFNSLKQLKNYFYKENFLNFNRQNFVKKKQTNLFEQFHILQLYKINFLFKKNKKVN